MKNRVRALQESMATERLGAYYVTSPFNRRYISGFTGSAGIAVVTANQAYFITDFRYKEQAHEQCEGFEIIIAGGSASQTNPLRMLQGILEDEGISRLGYEEEHITVADYDELDNLIDAVPVPASGMIEILRQEKDSNEIALVTKACEIADAAFNHILGFIKPGVTEIQVANELDFYMRSLGASGVSFDTIVASGKRSAMPHGVASDKVIQSGELITMDFGCYYKGYTSDITRTVALGEIDNKLFDIYHIVLEANKLVTETAKPGMIGKELDAIARDFISSHGYGENFGHSLGHSFGLDVHETPTIGMNSSHILKSQQLITNEPGIYIEDLGGVRIEDDLLLTSEGNQLLTHANRELIRL